jgi:hypothetical protein
VPSKSRMAVVNITSEVVAAIAASWTVFYYFNFSIVLKTVREHASLPVFTDPSQVLSWTDKQAVFWPIVLVVLLGYLWLADTTDIWNGLEIYTIVALTIAIIVSILSVTDTGPGTSSVPGHLPLDDAKSICEVVLGGMPPGDAQYLHMIDCVGRLTGKTGSG